MPIATPSLRPPRLHTRTAHASLSSALGLGLTLALHSAPALAAPAAAASAAQHGAPDAKASAAQALSAAAFEREMDAFLKAWWAELPDAAVAAGQYTAAARLPAPSAAGRERLVGLCQTWLKRLARLEGRHALSASQASDLALIRTQLQSTVWSLTQFRSFEWDPTEYNVGLGFGELLTKPFAPLPQRLQLIERRLAQVPAYFEAARAQIQRPSVEHLELAIEQNEGTLDTFRQDIPKAIDDAVKAHGLSSTRAKALRQTNARALKAQEDFIASLRALRHSPGFEAQARSFRIGAEAFQAKFGFDIQATVDAPTLYQRALQEKDALHARMSSDADQLWPQLFPNTPAPANRLEKISAVIDKLSEKHVSAEGLVDDIKARIPQLEAWVREHDLLTLDPSRPLQVRETPAYMRGVAGASISAPGPLDPQGTTWYNVTPLTDYTPEQAESYLREYNHWVLQILSIHEAVPGHYVQLLYSNKSPSKVKALFGNGAMVEGWAVYSERMMMESGYGAAEGQPGRPSPEMSLMYAKWNLRVVCNAILDHSVHVKGMGREEALHLLEKEAFQSHTEATEKWHRAQVTSVQLSSYFAGFSEILALREQIKAQQGAKFNLKAFHEEFLSHGSAPVAMVSRLMQARQQQRP
jgi:uncharacterized protein (DUF885 family)